MGELAAGGKPIDKKVVAGLEERSPAGFLLQHRRSLFGAARNHEVRGNWTGADGGRPGIPVRGRSPRGPSGRARPLGGRDLGLRPRAPFPLR